MSDEGRALLTEREREILSGEADVTDNYRYKVQSIVRNRVRKRVADDVDVLREHFPEVHEMLRDGVCVDTGDAESDTSDELATLPEGTLRSLRAALRALENGDPDVATARDELEAALEAIDE